MVQICPACNAENRDTAKFCDQCAAPLSPLAQRLQPAVPAADVVVAAGVATAAASAQAIIHSRQPSQINWTALLVLAAIVLGVAYVIKGPAPRNQAQLGVSSGAAAGANPMDTMQGVQKQLAALKAKLEKDPLDIAGLTQMYQMYGQIGQTEKMRPYLDSALEAWRRQNKFPPKPSEDAMKQLAGVALAALQSGDNEGGIEALKVYHSAEPDNLGVVATIGNLYYELGSADDAIDWYTLYLDRAKPAEQGDDYWHILVDRASMFLKNDAGTGRSIFIKKALEDLKRATTGAPKLWQGWHNLGLAYEQTREKDKALAAFKQAVATGPSPHDKWESESELARLQGKTPPPEPEQTLADPHGGMGTDNPHGAMPMPPGTPNPHTGM